MAFANSAEISVRNLPQGDPMRIVLDYLLEHARGRAHAQPWRQIEDHLRANGIQMSQTQFQQGILKQTREGEIFIGSNDHSPRGYYLIEDQIDAAHTREFYTRRIAAQQANLDHLDQLIGQEWNGNQNH